MVDRLSEVCFPLRVDMPAWESSNGRGSEMVERGKSISERAIEARDGKSASVGGENQPSGVQAGVSERVAGVRAVDDQDRNAVLKFFGHVMKRLRSRYEVNSGVPLAPPVGLHKSPSMVDIILEQRRQLREELSAYARDKGFETFEEAEDFDVPDDRLEPTTPWEQDFEPDVNVLRRMDDEKWNQLQARIKAARDARKRDRAPSEVPPKAPEKPTGDNSGEDAAAGP